MAQSQLTSDQWNRDCPLSCARGGEKGQKAKAEAKTLDSTPLKSHELSSKGPCALNMKSGACYVPGIGCPPGPGGSAGGQQLCLPGATQRGKHEPNCHRSQ